MRLLSLNGRTAQPDNSVVQKRGHARAVASARAALTLANQREHASDWLMPLSCTMCMECFNGFDKTWVELTGPSPQGKWRFLNQQNISLIIKSLIIKPHG